MSPASMPDAEYLPMSTRAHIDPKIHLAGAQNGEYLLQPNQLSAVLDGQVYTKALETGRSLSPVLMFGLPALTAATNQALLPTLHASLTASFALLIYSRNAKTAAPYPFGWPGPRVASSTSSLSSSTTGRLATSPTPQPIGATRISRSRLPPSGSVPSDESSRDPQTHTAQPTK